MRAARSISPSTLGGLAIAAGVLLAVFPSTVQSVEPLADDAAIDLAPASVTDAAPPAASLTVRQRGRLRYHMLFDQLRTATDATDLATRPRGSKLVEFRALLCDLMVFRMTDAQERRLKALNKELIISDGDDPFVRMADLFIAACDYSSFNGKFRPADRDALPRLLERYRAGKYPMLFAWLTTYVFALDAQNSNLTEPEKASWMQLAGDVLVETALSVKGDAPLEGLLVQISLTACNNDYSRLSEECITRLYRSDASLWLRNTFAGYWHYEHGFKLRGRGFANTVSKDAWNGFQRELDSAVRCLKLAYTADPSRPEPAAYMVKVTGAGGDDDTSMIDWLRRALAVQPDSSEAVNTALHFSRPRWGGSHEEMMALGEMCLDSGLFHTTFPAVYIDAVSSIYEDGHQLSDVRSIPNLLPNLNRLRDGYLARRSESGDLTLAQITALYWKLGRFSDANDLKRTIQGLKRTKNFKFSGLSTFRVDTYEFDGIGAYDPRCREYSEAADRSIAKGDFAAAKASLAHALELPNLYLEQMQGIKMKLALTRFMGAFASGGWAHVNAEDDCVNTMSFHRANKFFSPRAPASVQFRGPEGEALLVPDVGLRHEISTRIIFDESIGPKCTISLLPLANTEVFNRRYSQLIEFRPASKTVLIGSDMRKGVERPLDMSSRVLDVTLKCWDHSVVLIVNDELIFADVFPEDDIRESSTRFGIGVRGQDSKAKPIIFENLQLRRLAELPAELNRRNPVRPEQENKARDRAKPRAPRT